MFDFLDDEESAISILKDDHNKLKDLFDEFEKTDSQRQRAKICSQALEILKLHAAIEEHIFYPAAREHNVDTFNMDEADEEHHVAKILVAELDSMKSTEDHFDAKFKVLSESVRHHIKEEEGKIFPEAKKTDMDLVGLGKEMLSLRRQLIDEGVPKSAEDRMVAAEQPKSPTNTRASARGNGRDKAVKGAKASKKATIASRARMGNGSNIRTGAPL